MSSSDADSLPPAALPGYAPDRVEVVGRRLKMEYVGMASVFTVIGLGVYGAIRPWYAPAAATAATFCLFLGLKKKTRDHLVTSFLMYGAALIGLSAVRDAGWGLPFFFFGMLFWALEGYLEKRRNRIFVLPLIFVPWRAVADPFWPLGLAVIAAYLAEPRPDAPRLRRKLLYVFVAALVVAGSAALVFRTDAPGRLPLHAPEWGMWACLALPALLALVRYRGALLTPHRINATIFGLLATLDLRMLAVFGLAGTVLLAATYLRNSADSDALRPLLKHAEWYYFWLVLAAAIVVAVVRLG